MASVQELILAAQSKQRKSPFAELAESALSGFSTGQKLKSQYLENAIQAIKIEQARKEQERMEQLALRKEKAIRDAQATVGGNGSPTSPSQKFKVTYSEDEKGYSEKIEPVDPPKLDDRLSGEVEAGRMTLKEAYEMKNRSGGGLPASLAYQMQKDAAEKQSGKQLPATQILAVNEGKNVARLLPEVEQAIQVNLGKFGPVTGNIRSINPYDVEAQTFDARMTTAAQAFGRFMEKGVLRKEDELKYKKMFPKLSDPDGLKVNKLAIIRRQLAEEYQSQRQALKDSGYDVSGLGELEIPDSIFGESKESATGIPKVGDTFQGLKVKSIRRKS